MKSSLNTLFTAFLLTVPVLSFAQSNEPLTRTQVRAELVQLQKAGFEPWMGNSPEYPGNFQAAEARIAAQNKVGQANRASVEPTLNGSSQSGR
jgi:hypothetical protein